MHNTYASVIKTLAKMIKNEHCKICTQKFKETYKATFKIQILHREEMAEY